VKRKAHGQVRRSQVITTYGPGALIDLPHESAIVAGLDEWPPPHKLEEVDEPRLARKLRTITGVAAPRMVAPPAVSSDPGAPPVGIGAWRFPEWFVVQEADPGDGNVRSRRLVHRKALDDHRRFEGRPVVATRFVRACPRGHVDDVDWRRFVHRPGSDCPPTRPLWLDEQGTTGDLADLLVRCECGASRRLSDASMREHTPLGTCSGARPWLGRGANEECNLPSRLLVRTASNAWFPQVVSVLSLPERGSAVETAVRELWDDLQIVDDAADLAFMKKKPKVAAALAAFSDDEILAAIHAAKGVTPGTERSVKEIELEALLAAPEGYGDDVPVDENFHARRLPDAVWRRSERSAGIESVIQLHRLREVLALAGFTRFEAVTPDIHGEYDESDVERAALALEPGSFPAVENRGEGLFLRLRGDAVDAWLRRPAVRERLDALERGHAQWALKRKHARSFPGGPYVLLHTLSHLLIQSLAMHCGYPASSLRERIYAEDGRYGLLIYTGSPDAEGTLGGLVQQARRLEDHLLHALAAGALCSNDPTCAEHSPGDSMAERWLHGAACHGCALVAETWWSLRISHEVSAARSSPRPRARCATTTSTGPSWCRCSACRTPPSSAPRHDRGAAGAAVASAEAPRVGPRGGHPRAAVPAGRGARGVGRGAGERRGGGGAGRAGGTRCFRSSVRGVAARLRPDGGAAGRARLRVVGARGHRPPRAGYPAGL